MDEATINDVLSRVKERLGDRNQNIAVGVATFIFLFALFLFNRSKKKSVPSRDTTEEESSSSAPESSAPNQNAKSSKNAKTQAKVPKSASTAPNHHVIATLKGHTDDVLSLCFSPNGSLVATTSSDRSARLFAVTSWDAKDFKFQRINLEFDHAVACSFSADGSYLMLATHDKHIKVFNVKFSVSKKEFSPYKLAFELKDTHHKDDIVAAAISPDSKYMMTCGAEDKIRLWSLKGEQLGDVSASGMGNYTACISPDGRFVSAACFTSDIKVWHVRFGKQGTFEALDKAMVLRGHKSSVYSVCFSSDSKKMASLSKDKTWKLWDIDVRFEVSEDPRCVLSATVADPLLRLISISASGSMVALAGHTHLVIYAVTPGQPPGPGHPVQLYDAAVMQTIDRAHDGEITSIQWSPAGTTPEVLATASLDRRVRLWKFT